MRANKRRGNIFLKYSILLLAIVLFFSLNLTNANAMPINDFTKEISVNQDKVSKILKLKNVDVSILEDGRIKPIENPESLTKEEQVTILKLLKFTDEDIITFSPVLISALLNEGGVKVELEQEDFTHIYTDSQRNDHIVTPQTINNVNKIKLKDLQLNGEKSIDILAEVDCGNSSQMGSCSYDTFYGYGVLTYLGTTVNGKEYQYAYKTHWGFSRKPFYAFTDSVATSWQPHTVSLSTTSDYTRYANGYFGHNNRVKINRENVAGTKASIDIINDAGTHVSVK